MASETRKKKSKKLIILLVVAIIIVFSLISFIADMIATKNAEGNNVEQVEEKKNAVDYIKDVDVNDNNNLESNVPSFIAASYIGAVDGNTIRVCVDNDEVEVYLAGIISADKIDGIGMKYRNQAREWISNRFTEGMNLYLEVVNSYTDGSYTAYVYDQKEFNFTNKVAFWTHCINAKVLLNGHGNIDNNSIGSRSEWMYEAVTSAQSSYAGMWDNAESYRVCNYSVPERFTETETEISNTEAETETKKSKKGKTKKNKKATETIDSTQG